MWKYFSFFVIFVTSVNSFSKIYDNYQVFEITPTTVEQVKYVSNFAKDPKHYIFLKPSNAKYESANLMVAPDKLEEFTRNMNASKIKYEMYIENFQSFIDKQNPLLSPITDPKDFSWTRYHSLEMIYSWLESLAERYSEVKIIDVGRSYQGREIKGVKLSFGDHDKPGIFVEAGIHASEWIGSATATYLLNELLTSKDPEVRILARSYDWYFVPVFNPDGYVYTYTEDRLWRKSRAPNSNGCFGVDLNRNWDDHWMGVGSTDDPCGKFYAGKRPFSEVETKTISEYIISISDKLFAYIALHSFRQALLIPYGYTTEHLDNYDELFFIGKEATKSLQKVHGTKYVVGNTPEIFRFTSGSSPDWAKAKLKLPIVYTYELRDTGKYAVALPPEQIIPNGEEVLKSFVTLFKEASKMGYPAK